MADATEINGQDAGNTTMVSIACAQDVGVSNVLHVPARIFWTATRVPFQRTRLNVDFTVLPRYA